LTTALEGDEGSAWRPGRSLPHGKDPVPIVQAAGWAPGPVWTGAENLAPQTGIRSPARPARSQSLYRLSYRAHSNTDPSSNIINPLTLNDPYGGRTAPLTSKRCILYLYSTNIGIEYFKHGLYSPFLTLQNAVCFIILTYLVPVLFTFYIQGVLK